MNSDMTLVQPKEAGMSLNTKWISKSRKMLAFGFQPRKASSFGTQRISA
jgi:hypothetical protein